MKHLYYIIKITYYKITYYTIIKLKILLLYNFIMVKFYWPMIVMASIVWILVRNIIGSLW